jgi:hypothetical protein
MRRIVIAALAVAASACGNESFAPAPAGKEQIAVIGKGDVPARYFLMEQEKMPNGRLNAIVLQQFKSGKPGFPIGFQIDCANGPRWFNNGGDTLAALRSAPARDDQMQIGERDNESAQIARWLCEK